MSSDKPSASRKERSIPATIWHALSPVQRRRTIISLISIVILVPLLITWMSVKDKIFQGPERTPPKTAGAHDQHDEAHAPFSVRTPAENRTTPPPAFTAQGSRPNSDEVAQKLLSQIVTAAAQQQRTQPTQEQERVMNAVERSRICQACGGSGSYRYVDAYGQLQLRNCTHCFLGKKW